MKKIIIFTLTALLILGSGTVGVLAASSYFGYGAAVVANDVTMLKTGLLGKKLTFNDADFKSALCIGDFESITVTKIPPSTEGTLLIGGRRVTEGRVIKQKNLGALVFVPASDKISEASFSFTAEGYMGGEEIRCLMQFIGKVNYAPTVENSSVDVVNTQENVSVFGTIEASDPEGDDLEYIIVSYPKNGRAELNKETGKFSYTPDEGYTGKDSFIYVVRDRYGNYTEPVKQSLRVGKRLSDTVYTDMTGREEYNGALAMTALGVMGGKILGDEMYFMPEETVSRAEFAAMALKSLGIKADSTLSSTYFDDDKDIPSSLKGYIATAQRLGVIGGDFEDGRLCFYPNETITKYEAAKIMAALLGVDGESEEDVFADNEDIPVWARGGVSAMRTLGIFDSEDAAQSSKATTRADTAEFLYKLCLLKK